MYKKILSIIIPTYNMEKYLRRCLDSLLIKGNFKLLEVWVVNDGSKDFSSAIAHEYADKYPLVFNVIDKQNGNYGSCINAALPCCTGKYVKVLDSDDYFNTVELKKLIDRLIESNSEIILLNYTIIYSKKKVIKNYNYSNGEIVMLNEISPQIFDMHSIAYKTEVFSRFYYHQTEGISYTDTEWIIYPFLHAETLQYFPINVYQYVLDREGQTMSPKIFGKRIGQLASILAQMLDYLYRQNEKIPNSKRVYVESFMISRITMVYRTELIFNNKQDYHRDELIAFDKLIAHYDMRLYKKIELSKFKKIKYIKIFHKEYRKMPELLRRLIVSIPNLQK